MPRFHIRLLPLILFAPMACEGPSAPSAEAQPQAAAPVESAPQNERFTGTGLVDLAPLLHESPERVEAILGAPTDTGVQRVSCVRFVPERVFFGCKQEVRLHSHPQLERIEVEYEDGLAAKISLVGLPGEGTFTPQKALALGGLSLPGSPRPSTPTFGLGDDPDQKVEAWDWFNSSARLRVDGQQFRVRVSVVNGDWKRSKLEVINNTPLDDDQRGRVKPSKGQAAAAGEAVSEDPAL